MVKEIDIDIESQIKQNIRSAFNVNSVNCFEEFWDNNVDCQVYYFFQKIEFILENTDNNNFLFIQKLKKLKNDFKPEQNWISTFVEIERILNSFLAEDGLRNK